MYKKWRNSFVNTVAVNHTLYHPRPLTVLGSFESTNHGLISGDTNSPDLISMFLVLKHFQTATKVM